jgi:hypothetical protein
MPTPPWHGHLLRGITEVSRKLGDRCSKQLPSSWQRCPTLSIACGVPNKGLGIE